jgi:hypothetical protein
VAGFPLLTLTLVNNFLSLPLENTVNYIGCKLEKSRGKKILKTMTMYSNNDITVQVPEYNILTL